jgi:hypothetical protein
MCRCPERDKLRSLPRTPTPHGSPPADAGALGAAEATVIELSQSSWLVGRCFPTLSVSRAASRRYEVAVTTALYHRFLERIVARVFVTALLQRGYTARDNGRECPDEA